MKLAGVPVHPFRVDAICLSHVPGFQPRALVLNPSGSLEQPPTAKDLQGSDRTAQEWNLDMRFAIGFNPKK